MSGGIEEMHEMENQKGINWKLLDDEVNQQGDTLKQVISDLKKRECLGLQKYGKALSRYTDEDMLQHLYEELLDASMYIKTLILQRKTL